jgi:hypothetical protein
MTSIRLASRPASANALRNKVLGAAIAAALALPQAAGAFEANTGNDDLSIRWDNTVRVNIVKRAENQDKAILGNPNFDDGDRNFADGASFMRFDLLSEFDLVWKKALGFRVSAAGWYDGGYNNLDNDNLATVNNLGVNGLPQYGLSDYANRYAKGPSGEFLDVFAFAKFDVGNAPVNIKLGQTTVYWGESLLLGGAIHGVSYSQNPIDIWKGLATPGAEAKELFRPRVGFNVQSTVTDNLSIAAQYFFNWQSFSNQAYRYPESGTYLSISDALLWGGDSFILGPNALRALNPAGPAYLRAWSTKAIEPEENSNNYGLSVRWSPEWLGGTLGAYYRKTYDMQPQLMLTNGFSGSVPAGVCRAIGGESFVPPAAPPTTAGPCIINKNVTNRTDVLTKGKVAEYNVAFADDIDIYGISLSKNVFGLSLGAELSYRKNMSLLSDPVVVLPAPLVATTPGAIATTAVPEHGTPGALGDTMHGLINLVGVVGETWFFDTASWSTELTWMTWLDVNQNEAVFKGRKGYDLIDAVDKNYFGLGINFTPTWFQVFPSVDFLAPLSWSQGFANSAVTAGGQDGSGTFGVGVAMDIRQKYRIDLKYVGFYGDNSKCPRANVATQPALCLNSAGQVNTGAVDVFNGTNAIIADRDFVSLTFKTTF